MEQALFVNIDRSYRRQARLCKRKNDRNRFVRLTSDATECSEIAGKQDYGIVLNKKVLYLAASFRLMDGKKEKELETEDIEVL